MPQRDITGKEFYKNINFRSKKRDSDNYCFIGVRTDLDTVGFFLDVFNNTGYLFELSESSLDIVIDSENFVFKSFVFKDSLSKYFMLCFVNQDFAKNQYLLGEDELNACFLLEKSKKRNQLSFSFENEQEIGDDNCSVMDEEMNWKHFKETMLNTTIDLKREINFLFPVKIQTYEVLKPLFLKFTNMQHLTHRLIFPHEIEGVEALLTLQTQLEENLYR